MSQLEAHRDDNYLSILNEQGTELLLTPVKLKKGQQRLDAAGLYILVVNP